jgi:hypothetical protein
MKTELVMAGNITLEALRDSGKGWLVVRPVCDFLGLPFENQRKRLARSHWASTAILEAEGADGRRCEMFCLEHSKVAMWLVTIDSRKVKDPTVRARLEALQELASDALDRWFRGAGSILPAAPAPSSSTALDAFEAMVKAMREQDRRTSKLEQDTAALAVTQANQGIELRELVEVRKRSAELLTEDVLPRLPQLPGISLRTKAFKRVKYGAELSGRTVHAAFTLVYNRFQDEWHIDLRQRAENRHMSVIEYCESAGLLEKLLAVVEKYLVEPALAANRRIGHA